MDADDAEQLIDEIRHRRQTVREVARADGYAQAEALGSAASCR